MDKNTDILNRLNHKDGMTVPDGFFDDFAQRMEAALPERPELSTPSPYIPRTTWQRIRPYVYMAAMFAGVWCMLKMFSIMGGGDRQPLESNPIVAEAFENEKFVNDYIFSDVNQWDIYDQLMEEGIDAEALCDSLAAFDSLH